MLYTDQVLPTENSDYNSQDWESEDLDFSHDSPETI